LVAHLALRAHLAARRPRSVRANPLRAARRFVYDAAFAKKEPAMRLKAMLAVAATALALAAPLHAANLRWAAQNDILTLDPHSQNHATTNAILMHAYEGLTRYNEKYEVEPCLATKWTFISPTQVRFELRKGVKFHDGTPFNADDVLFSFGRIKQPKARCRSTSPASATSRRSTTTRST
jgi:ABC-type transport system substrate-binding protein